MGPLKGVRVVEVGGLGAVPFCGMMLSDMGADVLRVVRKGEVPLVEQKYEALHRGRRSVGIDLRKPEGAEAVRKLAEQADALQEGFRPGVMERLGLGPEVCLERNPKLVYARLTGWGQEGPLCRAAGHDINYIALSGALHAIGRRGEKPIPPINLLGDFGGGGMLQAFGIVCALLEARESGQGQVVDTAMVDGAAALMAIFFSLNSGGFWSERGTNLLDGGAHFYDTYETADGKYVAVGSVEPKFYAEMIRLAGIEDPDFQNQMDMTKWPELKEKIARVFRSRTRREWCDIMEGTDACFAPVLTFHEAIRHPHNVARKSFVELEGVTQPAPAPRFSRTRCEIRCAPPGPGADTETALADWGFDEGEIKALKDVGAI